MPKKPPSPSTTELTADSAAALLERRIAALVADPTSKTIDLTRCLRLLAQIRGWTKQQQPEPEPAAGDPDDIEAQIRREMGLDVD